MVAIAQSVMLRDRTAEVLDWTDRAIAIADAEHLPEVRMAALVERGSALISHPATVSEGRALLTEVADAA